VLATMLQPFSDEVGYRLNVRSPYSITERRVPQLIPVLGSQPEVM